MIDSLSQSITRFTCQPGLPSSAAGLAERQLRPAAQPGDLAQPAIGIDNVRVADGFQQRQIGYRVAVGVTVAELVTALNCKLADMIGLCLAICVEIDGAVVPPVGDPQPGCYHCGGTKHRADRPDDLLTGSTDDNDVVAVSSVALQQSARLGVDESGR